jgi:hypothetical protein
MISHEDMWRNEWEYYMCADNRDERIKLFKEMQGEEDAIRDQGAEPER